ncbi:hypothetical protein BDP27DRAFT_1436129 [Rhodocollybia butyracea]|uniref:Transmembrane protein n=1 Tax=Rhodocollybia butyracea TaxID=206335 RepID=A0A9P5P6W2_9AGAR|nr:hypothetical protein BDP27DRAFT_1436129 [Rhodocollybia butyracea]
MPAHPSVFSLKELILVGAFVKFVLSMVTAVLMRHHNGAVNDRLWTIGVVVMAQQFLSSVVEWIDVRNQENRLHDMMKKRSTLLGMNSGGNMNSAQISSTGLITVAATRNGQLGQDGQTNGVVFNPWAMINKNTPSPTLIPSTCSSASLSSSDELSLLSQNKGLKARSRLGNEGSKADGAELEMQRLRPVLTERNINVAPLAAGVLLEAKGTSKALVAIEPHMISIENNTRSCTKDTLLVSPCPSCPGSNTVETSGDRQYNKQTDLGQYGMIAHNNPLKTSAIPLVLAASSTLHGTDDSESSLASWACGSNQRLHVTTEDDETGMQEYRETTPGSDLDDVAFEERITGILHDDPLTTRDTNVESPSTADSMFPSTQIKTGVI